MKSLLLSAGLFGLVYAQAPTLPSCATTCVTKFTAGSQIGTCSAQDIVCICSSASFLSDIACCLAEPGGCDAADQQQAIDFAHNLCGINGVTNLPTAVVCASTASSGSSTGSSTSSPTPTTGTGSTTSSGTSGATTATSSTSSTSSSATPNSGNHNVGGGIGAAILGAAVVLL